jgi:hypothetical protein
VRGGDVEFRQIERFAIYAYDIRQKTLCRVAHYPDVAQPYVLR